MKRHWTLLLVLAILVLAGVGSILSKSGSAWNGTFDLVLTLGSVAFGLYQYSYRRVERFRLTIERVRAFVLNIESEWSLLGEFEISPGTDAFAQAKSAIELLKTRGDKTLNETRTTCVYSMRGLTIKLAEKPLFDPVEGERSELRLEFPSFVRPYRSWDRAIDEVVIPLASGVEKAAAPASLAKPKYTVEIRFRGANPYFGLWVAQVPEEYLARFDIEYIQEIAAEKSAITVRRDRLGVVSGSLQGVAVTSKRYLRLSSVRGS